MYATASLEDQVFDLKEQLKARDDDVKVYNNLSSDFWVNFLPHRDVINLRFSACPWHAAMTG